MLYNTNFLWDMNKNLQNNGIQNGKRKELSAWYENNHNCFEQRKEMDYLNACISIVCLFICFFVYIYLVFWLVLSLSLVFISVALFICAYWKIVSFWYCRAFFFLFVVSVSAFKVHIHSAFTRLLDLHSLKA